jgi:hypothetical protein
MTHLIAAHHHQAKEKRLINRARFLAASSATMVAASLGRACADEAPSLMLAEHLRVGASLSLAEMLYELGFGAAYDKQIGFGHELDGESHRAFVETQVGNGDHACNPNTLKKVYLKTQAFADVFTPYPAMTYVTRSGNMLTRWGDGVGPDATALLLLDAKALYDPRRATITRLGSASVAIDGRAFPTTHVVAHYPSASGAQLRTVELWLTPAVPLGLAKMTATAPDVDPFTLSVYKFTRHFKTELAMSLTTIRALTPTGDVPVIQ